jgi:hypothetical protein
LEGNSVEIHHIIYSLVPHKGYAVRAWSSKEVIGDFEKAFKGWLCPFEQALIRPGVELRAIVKSPRGIFYLARVFQGEKLDEMKRSGAVSHIAMIPAELAIEKKLSFIEVEKSMITYTNYKGIEIGDIETLKIENKEIQDDQDLEYLKKLVDKEIGRKILSEISKPYGKLIVIFKRDEWFRAKLAYALAKMFSIHGLSEYIITTSKPNDSVLVEFETATLILDKMIPLSRSWDWSVVKIVEKEEHKPTKDIEDTLQKIWGKGG